MMEVDKCVKCGDNLWRYGAGNPLKCRNCDTYQTTDAPTTPDDKLPKHLKKAEAAVRAAAVAYGDERVEPLVAALEAIEKRTARNIELTISPADLETFADFNSTIWNLARAALATGKEGGDDR